jgi:hypothetical protein
MLHVSESFGCIEWFTSWLDDSHHMGTEVVITADAHRLISKSGGEGVLFVLGINMDPHDAFRQKSTLVAHRSEVYRLWNKGFSLRVQMDIGRTSVDLRLRCRSLSRLLRLRGGARACCGTTSLMLLLLLLLLLLHCELLLLSKMLLLRELLLLLGHQHHLLLVRKLLLLSNLLLRHLHLHSRVHHLLLRHDLNVLQALGRLDRLVHWLGHLKLWLLDHHHGLPSGRVNKDLLRGLRRHHHHHLCLRLLLYILLYILVRLLEETRRLRLSNLLKARGQLRLHRR